MHMKCLECGCTFREECAQVVSDSPAYGVTEPLLGCAECKSTDLAGPRALPYPWCMYPRECFDSGRCERQHKGGYNCGD